jgi:hypothetical protein
MTIDKTRLLIIPKQVGLTTLSQLLILETTKHYISRSITVSLWINEGFLYNMRWLYHKHQPIGLIFKWCPHGHIVSYRQCITYQFASTTGFNFLISIV